MKKIFLMSLCFLLLACDRATPVFEKLSSEAVILAFGDSITYGTGASKDSNYPNILSKFSFHKVINSGVPGEVTQAGVSRLPGLLDKHQPELLLLIHGGNDMIRKIPPQQIANNLKQMINEAKQRNIKVVMLGVPKPSLFLLDSAEIYSQVAEELNIPIDLQTLPKILSDNTLKSDAIHPNQKGYKILAESIFNLLVNTGAL